MRALALLVASMACATNDGHTNADVHDTTRTVVREVAPPVIGSRADTTPAPRVTGGPQRPRPEARASGCGGSYLNVIVRQSALEGTTLARVADELTASLTGVVGAPSLSPAIRAFRVQARDSAHAGRMVERLRGSAKVESAERDQCRVMLH